MANTSNLFITGGAGFIGSHLVRRMVRRYPDLQVVNIDLLTYAGNLENLRDVEDAENYHFEKGDIQDTHFIEGLFEKYQPEGVIHLAAESHVDRSIEDPLSFIDTNIRGTAVLLNACRKFWLDGSKKQAKNRFYQISTDEVFGSLGDEGAFDEQTAYDPRSPYSASKAAADHLVRAYGHTYNLPVVLSNCSNNYGSHQFPEKLIPLMIRNIVQQKPLPVYGEGLNVRDWLHVADHAAAIDLIYHEGKIGESYCVGGNSEWKNIDLVRALCRIMDQLLERPPGSSEERITFVKDRAGHDHRYAIDTSYIKETLGWEPKIGFEEGLRKTAQWYLDNTEWMEHVTSGAYQEYYRRHYTLRDKP